MKTVNSVILLPFLIILLYVTPVIGSSNWVEYYRDNNGTVYSYKQEIAEKNRVIQVWDKEVFSEKGREKFIREFRNKGWATKGYDKLSYKHVLCEIDCKKKKARMLFIAEYDNSGNELFSYSFAQPEWENIDPDSNWNILRKIVCK
jgi:hypothetical protein